MRGKALRIPWSLRPLASGTGSLLALLCELALSPSCGSAEADLTVLQRHIHPARLVVQRLDHTGGYEIIEIVPPREVVRVARTTRSSAGAWLGTLVDSGYFSWPDTSLVPPPHLDVDSDPILISLSSGDRARTVSTRAPHVPPPLQAFLDSLAVLSGAAEEVENCVVCLFSTARGEPASSHTHLSERVLGELRRSKEGRFPVVLSEVARKELPLEEQAPFDWPATHGRLRVECLPWKP